MPPLAYFGPCPSPIVSNSNAPVEQRCRKSPPPQTHVSHNVGVGGKTLHACENNTRFHSNSNKARVNLHDQRPQRPMLTTLVSCGGADGGRLKRASSVCARVFFLLASVAYFRASALAQRVVVVRCFGVFSVLGVGRVGRFSAVVGVGAHTQHMCVKKLASAGRIQNNQTPVAKRARVARRRCRTLRYTEQRRRRHATTHLFGIAVAAACSRRIIHLILHKRRSDLLAPLGSRIKTVCVRALCFD